MSNFIGRPPFSNSLWVGIETMQFHIAQTKIFLRTPSFPIQGVPMNNLAPMKNCPGGVQGNLNWMPGYWKRDCDEYIASMTTLPSVPKAPLQPIKSGCSKSVCQIFRCKYKANRFVVWSRRGPCKNIASEQYGYDFCMTIFMRIQAFL